MSNSKKLSEHERLAAEFFRRRIGEHDLLSETLTMCSVSPKRLIRDLVQMLDDAEADGRRLQAADDDCGTYYDNFVDR